MARGDRLYSLVEHLRRRRTPTTVGELADRFGVSERTLFRDLALLRDEGVPVEAEPGRGGGVRLLPHYSMPPLNLSLDEAVAVWLACRVGQKAGTFRAKNLEGALDKLVGALPVERRRALQRLERRIVVGRPANPQLSAGAQRLKPQVLELVEAALFQARALAFSYVDREGNPTRRVAAPHGVLVQAPLWYVLAVDVEKDAPRMFRIDRMSDVVVRDDVAFLPRDPWELFEELGAVGA